MESFRTVMEWDIIFDNSWNWWIVYTLFLILALVMRRPNDRLRRRSGNVMLGFAVPGMIIVIVSLGMFIYDLIWILSLIDPVTHRLNDGKLGQEHIDFNNSSLYFHFFSIPIVIIQSIASVIIGGNVIRKGRGSDRLIGAVSVISGIVLMIGIMIFTHHLIRAIGDP